MSHRYERLLPELKTEGEALLKELREASKSLDPAYTLVGFFNIDNADDCVLFPTVDCVAVTLSRDVHVEGRENVQVSVAPVIESDDKAFIGGENWFYSNFRGKRVYTRENGVATGKNSPVGLLKNLNEVRNFPAALMVETYQDVQLLRCLKQMLDDSKRLGHQKSVRAPRILLPIAGRMRLRHGPALDNLVLDCATKGLWKSLRVGNFVRKHTEATVVSINEIVTRTPLLSGSGVEDDDVDPDYVVEDNKVVEHMYNPQDKACAVIFEIFGVTIPITFHPVAKIGETVSLAECQTLFTPLPRRGLQHPYTVKELKARPDYEALCYMAVLSAIEKHKHLEYIDSALACGDGSVESVVHIHDAEPVQRISTIMRENSGQRRFNPAALRSHQAHVDVDLFNLSIRAEVRRARNERLALVKRKEKEREEAKARRTPKDAMETYHADKLKAEETTTVKAVQSDVLNALLSKHPSTRTADGMLEKSKLGRGARRRLAIANRRAQQASLNALRITLEAKNGAPCNVDFQATISQKFDCETKVTSASAPLPVATPESSPGQVVAPAVVIDVEPISVTLTGPVAAMPPMPEIPVMPDITALPVLSTLEFQVLSELPIGQVNFTRYFLHTMISMKIARDVLYNALTTLHNSGFIVVTPQTITRSE